MPIVDQFGGNTNVATPNSAFLKRDIPERDIHTYIHTKVF